VIAVCDGDCILMAQKLAAELGIAVGIGSGANFLADVRRKTNLVTMPPRIAGRG
jgi:cysteine synthase A